VSTSEDNTGQGAGGKNELSKSGTSGGNFPRVKSQGEEKKKRGHPGQGGGTKVQSGEELKKDRGKTLFRGSQPKGGHQGVRRGNKHGKKRQTNTKKNEK